MCVEHRDSGPASLGCAITACVAGVFAMATGVGLVGRWTALPVSGRLGPVVLFAVGAMLTVPFMLLLGLRILPEYARDRTLRKMAKASEAMLRHTQAIFAAVHEFREAADQDMVGLDHGWYRRTTQEFAEAGYRHLGDVFDVTMEAMDRIRCLIRVMTSPDGTVAPGFYHLIDPRASAAGCPPLLGIELSTELTDGTSLLTSNTAETSQMTSAPAIIKCLHSQSTSVAQLIEAHEAEKRTLLASRPGVACVTIRTLSEAMESANRQQAVVVAFRRQIGYLDPEEVRRVARARGQTEEQAALWATLAQQARQKAQESRTCERPE